MGERYYIDESLALLNYLKPVMNLWKVLISALEEASAKGPQPQLTKGWEVKEELLNSLQLLLIATYPAIVRQQPNLAVPHDKTDN